MVGAAVAEREDEGLVAEREPEQLVAEADPVHRHLAEQRPDRLHLVDEDGGVAGAVRDEDGARPRLEDRVGVPPARHDVRLDAALGEAARDRALRAEVDDDDPRPGADRVRLLGADGAVERAAVDRRLRERAGVERVGVAVAERAAERRCAFRIRFTSVRVSTPESATTPRLRSQAANAGRASRMTTASHCTRSDSIRASSTP